MSTNKFRESTPSVKEELGDEDLKQLLPIYHDIKIEYRENKEKFEDTRKRYKESFFGDFLFGGIIVSGIIIIFDSFNIIWPINLIFGIVLLSLGVFTLIGFYIIKKKKMQKREVVKKFWERTIEKMLTSVSFNLINAELYEQAIEYLEEALKIDKDNKYNWHNKGIAVTSLGRIDEGKIYFEEALKLDPNFKEALVSKGITLSKLRQYSEAEALECYDKALVIDPNYKKARILRGYALIYLGDSDQAKNEFDEILKLDLNNKHALLGKANALIGLKQDEEANMILEKILKIYPDNKFALSNIAATMINGHQFEKARRYLDKVLKIDPNYSLARYNMACLESLQMNKKEAVRNLKIAIEHDKSKKERAKSEPNFDNIRDSDEFQVLIGE